MSPIFHFDLWYWCIQPNLQAFILYCSSGMLNPGFYVEKASAEAYYDVLGLPASNGTLGVFQVIYEMTEGVIINPITEEPVEVLYLLQPFWALFVEWYQSMPIEPADACRYRDYSHDN